MAITEQEFQRHLQGWVAFTKLMKWGVILVVIILVLLAYFLL